MLGKEGANVQGVAAAPGCCDQPPPHRLSPVDEFIDLGQLPLGEFLKSGMRGLTGVGSSQQQANVVKRETRSLRHVDNSETPECLFGVSALARDARGSGRRPSASYIDADGAMHFRADHETRQRLEAVIAAESSCCAFLSFELRADGEELVLSIAAPASAEPLVRDLVNAFAGPAEAR